MQSDGSRKSGEASRSFVSFLPEHALLSPGARLAVAASWTGSSDHTLEATGTWRTTFSFVSFASLLSWATDFTLVTILSWGTLGTSWPGQTHWTLDTISSGGTHRTSLSRSSFLSSRAWGALGSVAASCSDGTSGTSRTSLSRRTDGTLGTLRAFSSLQAAWTHRSGKTPHSLETPQSLGTHFAGDARRTRVSLSSLFAGSSR